MLDIEEYFTTRYAFHIITMIYIRSMHLQYKTSRYQMKPNTDIFFSYLLLYKFRWLVYSPMNK